jgi:hypothetical protein
MGRADPYGTDARVPLHCLQPLQAAGAHPERRIGPLQDDDLASTVGDALSALSADARGQSVMGDAIKATAAARGWLG